MNQNFLAMMAQRFPQMQQGQPQQVLQMLMARRQQMARPDVTIQPIRQPTSNVIMPPMNDGGNMLKRGPVGQY